MNSPYELFGVENLDGWKHLYEPVIWFVETMGGKMFQVKEKFGELRIYIDQGDMSDAAYSTARSLIVGCEVASRYICEVCGKPGTLRTGDWMKTLCDEHHEEREAARRKLRGTP